ncbi:MULTISPECIES: AAA family ATPase [Fusobacterium]|uniref:AAA family ATPase n=1 Tax=Fusobacterium TaxID=848 RepID=UPI00044A6FEA|nr:AAA family ATPase [Fusobacterium sp. CM1]EUB32273.1 putative AAA-ATPase [Fusobacterium sp. CM1]
MKKKRTGEGIDEFKGLIENNYYYFDKTKYIEDICDNFKKSILFTRPRRFGKTLNLSTLKYFFDIRKAEENRELFKDLYIEKSEYFKEQGQYPVIFITLKELKSLNWEEMIGDIKVLISRLYSSYKYLIDDLDELTLILFKSYIMKNSDISELKEALVFLIGLLYEKYNKEVVLLIDEYDTPLITANQKGYYKEAIDFFRSFFSSALKTNQYLKIGVLTGIVQVAKENIFSGLNNIITYNILGDKFETFFGLSEEEVENALKYFELEYKLEDVKKWYDGYKFGESEVYNPWSILNYINWKELKAYWVNTSDNALIYDKLNFSNKDIFDDLETLFSGTEIKKNISPYFTFEELNNYGGIWQLMVYSGYLKICENLGDDDYTLKIPNYEIQTFFRKGFIDRYLAGENNFKSLIQSLLEGNIEKFERELQNIFLVNTSFFDMGEEKVYHSFFLGMLIFFRDKYEVTSNKENGKGRYDILLKPLNKINPAYIFEFKIAENEKDLDKKSEEALKQIKDLKYDIGLKELGINKIYRVGVAFKGKEVKIKYEIT